MFTITVASPSLRVRQSNPRKCYPVDPALASAISFQASRAVGLRLENAVYLELRRRGNTLAYFLTADSYEIDFLAEHPLRGPQLVQVCADLGDPKTRRRELRALEGAMTETRIERVTLITLHQEEMIELAGGRVHIVPAWRWFLEPEEKEQ